MAVPDFIHLEGFDKYGPPGTNMNDSRNLPLWADEWHFIIPGSFVKIDTPASGVVSGHGSCQFRSANAGGSSSRLQRNLPANYARVVGGFTAYVSDSFSQCGMLFMDGGTTQLTILLNNGTGHIEVRRGDWGTLIAASTDTYGLNMAHCIEYDITFHGTAGIVKVWLDGILTSINLTGQNTISTANPYTNRYGPGTISASGQHNFRIDHMYQWFYLASGGTETPCLDNPIIETAQPTGDSTVAWSVASHALATSLYYYGVNNTSNTVGANGLYLRRVVADQSGSFTGVTVGWCNTNAPAAKHKAVVYADSSGVPGALLATGTEVVGATAGAPLSLPISLAGVTAGTAYWVGWINDTAINWACNDEGGTSYVKGNTYTSGPPSPAGTGFTTNSGNINFAVNMSGVTTHYPQNNANPSLMGISYNASATIGQRDLLSFPALSTTPTAIHGVSVKAMVARSDTGVRTIKTCCKSSATLSYGMNVAVVPAITWSCEGTFFQNDPATGVAWTAAGVAAALFGVEVIS